MGFVQDLVDKKNFPVQFEYVELKYIITCLITVILDQEEAGKGKKEIILEIPNKGEGELLIIYGDTVVKEGVIYGNDMYLSLILFFISFEKDNHVYVIDKIKGREIP